MKKHCILLAALPMLALGTFIVPSVEADGGSLRILKFEADWCGACKKMAPVYKKISSKYSSEASFQTIDIDSQKSLADRFGVEQIPTVIAIKNGKITGRSTGYMNEWKLNAFVKKQL